MRNADICNYRSNSGTMKMKWLDRESKGGVKCADDAEGNKRQWNRELNEARGDRPRAVVACVSCRHSCSTVRPLRNRIEHPGDMMHPKAPRRHFTLRPDTASWCTHRNWKSHHRAEGMGTSRGLRDYTTSEVYARVGHPRGYIPSGLDLRYHCHLRPFAS